MGEINPGRVSGFGKNPKCVVGRDCKFKFEETPFWFTGFLHSAVELLLNEMGVEVLKEVRELPVILAFVVFCDSDGWTRSLEILKSIIPKLNVLPGIILVCFLFCWK